MEISETIKEEKKTSFVIANFTNGKLKDESSRKVKFNCFEQTGQTQIPDERKKKMLVGEVDGMRYIGHSSAQSSRGLCKYMVGVLNKKSGKMRLYDCHMFSMKPEFLDSTNEEEDNADLSFVQKNDALTAAFGSTKKRRAMDSRLKNKLKEEVLQEAVGTAVDQAMEKPGAENLIAPQEKQVSATQIPPYDINAKKPQDVYKLSDIINEAEMEVMKGPAQLFVTCFKDNIKEWEAAEKYPHYVIHHLHVLPIDHDARLHKSCCLLYLHYMIDLYKLKAKDLRAKNCLPADMPDMVKKSLLDRFTIVPDNSKLRVQPARLKDKLASYILVLCLILDEFNMTFTHIQKDLRLSNQKIVQFLRALGCKLTSSGKGAEKITVVTLPVPLTFPDPSKRGGKGRR